jgi:NADPH-dependent 2,4-dienoyl-CoA reductase/sulfur reductase-like enzyme
VAASRGKPSTPLNADYQRGVDLVTALEASGARYWPETAVWSLNAHRRIGVLREGRASIIEADCVIVAGGAMERPVPFPGWTLPGVMNVGAAQILLKTTGVVPAEGTILAGSGPLLFLVASQYLQAGVPVQAVLEFAPPANYLRAARSLPMALAAGNYLMRGLRYVREVRRKSEHLHFGVANLAAAGAEQLEEVSFDVRHGQGQRRVTLQTNSLLVHFGVIPRLELTQSAGCRHVWDDGQQCWLPKADSWGETSVPGIAVIGDSAGIAGSHAAEQQGRLAALAAAHELGHLSAAERDQLAQPDFRRLQVDLRIRPFLEALHRLPESVLVASDEDTVVCRCEEVTAGAIRRAVHAGHTDTDQVKAYLRCGMGPCQGRQCSAAVSHLLADTLTRPVSDYRAFRVRPPIRPISIEELGGLTGVHE